MDKNEALKLALEALDCIYSPLHVHEIEKVGNAMKAIKEALAQPEQEPVANGIIRTLISIDKDGIETWKHELFYTTPPQRKQEQEPVEWDGKCVLGHCGSPAGCEDSDCCRADFTTPPQRKWVGLTEEEKNDCLVSADPCECLAKPESHQLMEDVETKLREKNGC